VELLTQGEIVALSLEGHLRRHPEIAIRWARRSTPRFLTTDQSESFDRLAELFLGHPVTSHRIDLSEAGA